MVVLCCQPFISEEKLNLYFGGESMGADDDVDDDEEEEEEEEEEEDEEEAAAFDVATLTPEELYLNDAGQVGWPAWKCSL